MCVTLSFIIFPPSMVVGGEEATVGGSDGARAGTASSLIAVLSAYVVC